MEYKNRGAVDDADDDDDEEEEEEEEIDNFPASAAPVSYNPPSLRGSAFSKPILHPSASLVCSPRGGGASAAKNVSLFGTAAQATSPLYPPPAPSLNSSDPAAAAGNSAPPSAYVRYRECLRNHAAASGGHVLDGCGEFMPESGRDLLKCAACGCHRSFHRKVDGGDPEPFFPGAAPRLPLLLPPPHPHASHHHNQKRPPPFFQFGSPTTPSSGAVAFGSASGGATTESSSEERVVNAGAPTPVLAHRKRFRTKFTAEQKEKMQAFAERVGWRFQRQDEALVEQVCAEAGIRRQVLKVWMHNNKHLIKKHQQQQQQPPPPLRLEPEPLSQLHHHQHHSSQQQQQQL